MLHGSRHLGSRKLIGLPLLEQNEMIKKDKSLDILSRARMHRRKQHSLFDKQGTSHITPQRAMADAFPIVGAVDSSSVATFKESDHDPPGGTSAMTETLEERKMTNTIPNAKKNVLETKNDQILAEDGSNEYASHTNSE